MSAQKILSVFLCFSALANITYAANPGVYFGAGLGLSKLMTTDDYPFDYTVGTQGEASKERGGLGGRVFIGYNLNQYLGLEGGYAGYAASKYNATVDHSSSSLSYGLKAFDLVAKAYLPVSDSGFNLYALGGAALATDVTRYNDGGVPAASGYTLPASGASLVRHKILPVYGAGIGYDFSKAVSANIEFSHLKGWGNTDTNAQAIPSANLLTLNFSYHF